MRGAWRFEPELEAEFAAASYDHAVVIVRFGLLLAIALYAIFGILDVYMLPESHRSVWTIRFAVVIPLLLLALLASTRHRFQRAFRPAVILVSMLLGAGILGMIAVSEAGEAGHWDYYTGLLLVILWIGTFSQLGGWDATFCVATILAGYAAVLGTQWDELRGGLDNPDFARVVESAFFLVGSSVLGIFSAFSFEQLKRKRFLQRREIASEKETIQSLLQQIETLFGQQVSEEVARELASGAGEAESKLCQVTVLFLDIRDFTSYADSRAPEEVASFQNAVFGEMINIIRSHRGIINQILGDGVMATFGAPVESETHTADAVRAGLAMLARVEELGREGRIPQIRVGIGLHTGQVLAGNIGNELRKQYSITGRTVNMAARIEALNKDYGSQLLVSGEVWERIRDQGHSAEDLGDVQLRGFSEPTRLLRLA